MPSPRAPPVPDRMTSLPQPFQGVGSDEPRAATASGLSRLASSSAKLASTNAGRRVLSLFAGIGGFDLGLERAGFQTTTQCEIDPFARAVLAKHWPEVPYYDDVRTLTAERLAADGIAIDVICGGFPCQDISIAGKGRGLSGKRSGLWSEFRRLIDELRPAFAIIENSPKLRDRGLLTILTDLDALGYDAEWHCIPASHVGAPHRRDRLWIIAYRQGNSLGADPDSLGPHSPSLYLYRDAELRDQQVRDFGQMAWWRTEPDVERVVDGPPSRMDVDRIRVIGNAVLPDIPELIGNAIRACADRERAVA
jgi:DNA (cytosine-5)-methyltransferase 1